MRKTMSLVLSLTFISTVLFGCQSGDNTTKNTDKNKIEQETEVVTKTDIDKIETNQQSEEDNEKLKLVGEISKIKISELGKIRVIVFEDDESIETIESIISSAVKEEGIVNMVNPEFKMFVFYTNDDNEQSFYLWIGEKGERSTFMNSNDTNTIYTVSEEMTDKLIDLIE